MSEENKVLEHTRLLTEVESKEVLIRSGIPVVETKLARSKSEAVSLGREMGFPVVMKIMSPDIIHKSDYGCVRLNLEDPTQIGLAYDQIMASATQHYPGANIHGVSVQKMCQPGVEVIVGITRDPQFGPIIMFGLGGVFVEVLKDVSFRVVPITEHDAGEMIREIKGYSVLEGYRGRQPADIGALETILVKVSELAKNTPQIRELDLNPVFAYPDGAIVVDARIILDKNNQPGIQPGYTC